MKLYASQYGLECIALRYFNVYGPRQDPHSEYSGVISIFDNRIKQKLPITIYGDGEQYRDFIYVKDVTSVCMFLMNQRKNSGIYNLGTGQARSFYDLAVNTFSSQNLEPNIEFIDMPQDIRDKYQYFTEARMEKLKSIGYKKPFYSLEDGIADYVKNYLLPGTYY